MSRCTRCDRLEMKYAFVEITPRHSYETVQMFELCQKCLIEIIETEDYYYY